MVTRKTWEDFRAAGFLWWVNRVLHVFGWAIVCAVEDDGRVSDVYPARVKFRGFDEESESQGHEALSAYMVTNGEKLYRECQE